MRRLLILAVSLYLVVISLGAPTKSRADANEHLVLARPIPRAGKPSRVDRGFPYGWTRYDKSPIHHGVDFENGLGVPVVAAADGTVNFAGNDSQTVVGPQPNFYGNVVVVSHAISAEGAPVSTLYGHLNTVLVQAGQQVKAGQKIGTVGMTGIALWYHLHFEVRVGDPHDYNAVRNPELWLVPQPGRGTLVGRMVDMNGGLAMGIKLIVHRAGYTAPSWTYADPVMHSDPAYHENFTVGDLPAGCYELSVRDNNGGYATSQKVCVTAGHTSFVDVKVGKIY
ncbi:MAG TPA: M23 family metallopeptidase [Aggregatilineales bacterium]|nr:M23 family metallopeptidase [Aggregatilineales bacterium]